MRICAIHHLSVIRCFKDGRPWDVVQVNAPAWEEVEYAIRRLDNDRLPLVQLDPSSDDDNEAIFNVLGGAGRWTLFQIMGEWRYEDPAGGDGEVRLWEGGQTHVCRERNVLRDLESVLAIARRFYLAASYEELALEP